MFVFLEDLFEERRRTFHPVSSSRAVSEVHLISVESGRADTEAAHLPPPSCSGNVGDVLTGEMSESVEKSVWVDVTRDVHSPESGKEELVQGNQISIAATPWLDWDAPPPLFYFPLENLSECRRAAFGRGRDLNFLYPLCSRGRFVPRHGLSSRPLSLRLCQNALGEPRSFQYLLECYQNHSERLRAINGV